MQKKQQFRSGDSMRRVEDEVLITGKGEFTDNLQFPDMVYLHLVRSPHARATVKKIETQAARSMPGVLDILGASMGIFSRSRRLNAFEL